MPTSGGKYATSCLLDYCGRLRLLTRSTALFHTSAATLGGNSGSGNSSETVAVIVSSKEAIAVKSTAGLGGNGNCSARASALSTAWLNLVISTPCRVWHPAHRMPSLPRADSHSRKQRRHMGQEERVLIHLTPLIEEGIIQVLRLEHQGEEATFVNLASMVDDGEAITAALAVHRGCAVATDDRKARRVLAEHAPIVPLVSTLELLRQWAEESSIAQSDLHAAMNAMRLGASYVPGERDPSYEWWQSITREEAS